MHRMRGSRWRASVAVLAVVVLAAACTQDVDGDDSSAGTGGLPADVGAATFSTTGSVGQVHVSGATADQELALYDRDGKTVGTGTTDAQGALIFREVDPGQGYRVATTDDPVLASTAVRVESPTSSLPEQSFYDGQHLEPGFTYITTRDGTTLSSSVYLPAPSGAERAQNSSTSPSARASSPMSGTPGRQTGRQVRIGPSSGTGTKPCLAPSGVRVAIA